MTETHPYNLKVAQHVLRVPPIAGVFPVAVGAIDGAVLSIEHRTRPGLTAAWTVSVLCSLQRLAVR